MIMVQMPMPSVTLQDAVIVDKKINYKDLRWLKVYTNQGDLSKFFFFFRVLTLGPLQEFVKCDFNNRRKDLVL